MKVTLVVLLCVRLMRVGRSIGVIIFEFNFMLIGYNSSVQNWEAANGRKKKIKPRAGGGGRRRSWRSRNEQWTIAKDFRFFKKLKLAGGNYFSFSRTSLFRFDFQELSQWWFPTLIYDQCSKWMSIITFLKYRKIYFFVPCILFWDKYSTTFHFPSSWETGSKLVAKTSARQTALKFVM